MRLREQRAFAATRSLSDLGVAMSRWLRGDLRTTPSYLGPPNDETAEIRDHLVALNRAGVVTVGSQPGRLYTPDDGFVRQQRAYLEAYCDRFTSELIVEAATAAGLELHMAVVDDLEDEIDWDEVPFTVVSRNRLEDLTFCHHEIGYDEVEFAWRGIGDGARDDIEKAVWFTVLDPEWSRTDHMWQALRLAVGAEEKVPA